MSLDAVHRRGLQGRRVAGQVELGEIAQEPLRSSLGRAVVVGGRWMAVEAEKGFDVAARRQPEQPLLQAHQEIFGLGQLGFGFGRFDFPNRECTALAVPDKENAKAVAALLQRGHVMPPEESNMNAMSPRRLYQICTIAPCAGRRLCRRSGRNCTVRKEYRRRDLNPHALAGTGF